MSVDIEKEVERLIDKKNEGKKDEEKIEMAADLKRAIVKAEEVIGEFERHYSFSDLEKELDKIKVESDGIKKYIEREVQNIVK